MALHVSSFPLVASQGSRRGGERARHREQQDDQAGGMKTGANHGRALEVFVVLGVETSPFWRMYSQGDVPIQDTHFHLFEIWFLSFSPARLPLPSHTPLRNSAFFFLGVLIRIFEQFHFWKLGNFSSSRLMTEDVGRQDQPTQASFFLGGMVSQENPWEKSVILFRLGLYHERKCGYISLFIWNPWDIWCLKNRRIRSCTTKCLFGSGFWHWSLNQKNTPIPEIYLE